MEKSKITAVVQLVYGNERIYIREKDARDAIATLTGKKTVDNADIQALRSLGHEVEIINPYQVEE